MSMRGVSKYGGETRQTEMAYHRVRSGQGSKRCDRAAEMIGGRRKKEKRQRRKPRLVACPSRFRDDFLHLVDLGLGAAECSELCMGYIVSFKRNRENTIAESTR